ncbi:hypothetical protein IFM89_015522 [Coptis chinensis]|uniref:Uncharacterized protein n=1 Tax=Coptis chinensis TaxID=261450 RepID=A0A835IW45_9MAGN|nr:hypothetical protein IFM89_015522 [Coptis chinensis]
MAKESDVSGGLHIVYENDYGPTCSSVSFFLGHMDLNLSFLIGLGTGEKIGTGILRGSVKFLDVVSSEMVHGKSKSFASTSMKPLASENQAISEYKVKAGQAQNIRKSEPPVELLPKARPSSTLPTDFFDTNGTKRQKTGVGTGEKIGTGTLSLRSLDVVSSEMVHGKSISFSSTSVKPLALENQIKEPSIAVVATGRRGSFFDGMDIDATTTIDGSNVKQMERTLPDGFFEKDDAHTKRDVVGSEVKQVKGALPEGFFDNKDADQHARGIEPVKIDINEVLLLSLESPACVSDVCNYNLLIQLCSTLK